MDFKCVYWWCDGIVSGITTTGAYTQSGTSANTLTGATTLSNTLTVQTTTATQDQIIVQAAARRVLPDS
ncbi:MAG: hypothetical protein R3B12_01315 [Candidatus Saccharimonadales bacterium]